MARMVHSWTEDFLSTLVGTTIGHCTILAILPLKGHTKRLLARCECGREWPVYVYRIMRGKGTLCLCCTRKKAYVGAGGRKRMAHHPEWGVWRSMQNRCFRKGNPHYPSYGGRGITISERWLGIHGFENFLTDMGPRPSPKHQIDRINNNGNYDPGNCRWATATEQQRNKRDNHLLTFNGKTQTVADWADQLGLPASRLRNRLHRGWPIERVLSPHKHSRWDN